MKKQSGMTLLELMVAIFIVAILVSLAIPTFGGLMKRTTLKTKYNDLTGNISLARMEAVKRSRMIILCASNNGAACNSNNWHDGWIVFVDDNNNSIPDGANDTVLLIEGAAPSNITITSSAFGGRIALAPRGRLTTAGSFVFCAERDANTARALNLQVTGLARMATDGPDSDVVVEDFSNTNVTCP